MNLAVMMVVQVLNNRKFNQNKQNHSGNLLNEEQNQYIKYWGLIILKDSKGMVTTNLMPKPVTKPVFSH